MEIVDDKGVHRTLETWEIAALNAAIATREAEQQAQGIFIQWDKDRAAKELLGIVANNVDIPVEKAVHMLAVYPDWSGDNVGYLKDDRVSYMDALWRCLQDHKSQSDWSPAAAPSLWAKVLIGDITGDTDPEWKIPGSTNPYNQGDRVTHNGKTWVSLIANNVWEPGVQGSATLWEEID